MPVTLKDVARLANVTPPVVSRVLHNKSTSVRVSEATALRVREAAAQLGYRVNILARNFRARQTCTIGVLNGQGLARPIFAQGPRYFATLMDGIVEGAFRNSFSVTLCPQLLGEHPEEGISDGRFDGLIWYSISPSQETLEVLQRCSVPIVIVHARAGTTTSYAYDGQMGFEDQDTSSSSTTVTDYGLGARGIDYISANSGSGGNASFPLYDGHGNMIGTLARSGSGSFTTGNVREFDVWGSIRSGQATGDPKARYCASLGHKQDDESGMVHMRARLFEPCSGRFVSEDREKSGLNWFGYAKNNPVGFRDNNGTDINPDSMIALMALGALLTFAYQAAYRYVLPLIMLTAFATYCYGQIQEAGGCSAFEQGIALTSSVGLTFLIGKFAGDAMGNVLSACANAVGIAGDAPYFGILGLALTELAVDSIVDCGEIILDDSTE